MAAVSEVLTRLHIQIKASDYEELMAQVVGKKWEDSLLFLHRHFGIAQSLQQLSAEVLQNYRKRMSHGPKIIPGVLDKLPWLAKSFPLALVSGSHRYDILKTLEQFQLRSCFQVILGAEDYPQSKPAPDGFLLAARQLSLRAENCLVFEDSLPGIHSARAAGMRVVAIRHAAQFNWQGQSGPALSIDQSLAMDHLEDFTQLTDAKLAQWQRD